MKTAARVITFVSAGVGIFAAFICFIYFNLYGQLFSMAQSGSSEAELYNLEQFFHGLCLYGIIGSLVSAVFGFVGGAIFSGEADPSVKKTIGILCIVIGAFTNEVLLVGGVFGVIAASREMNGRNNISSNNNNYTVYR